MVVMKKKGTPITTDRVLSKRKSLVSTVDQMMVGCMMVVVMTMCLLPLAPTAHAAPLPPIIINGSYNSTDGTVSNTTLDVSAMLADAVTKGDTEAVCVLIRPTFEGTLTISLPPTPANWTTCSIPLRILIQDGASTVDAMMAVETSHIVVTGALTLGSSITVQGGAYNYSTNFMDLPMGIIIQNGSTLAIVGGAYRINPTQNTAISSILSSGSIQVGTDGTLSISNNNVTTSNVSVENSWTVRTLYIPFSITSHSISVETNATLTISNNSMSASNVSVGGDWIVYTISMATNSHSPLSIVSNGTVSIANNTMEVYNVSVGSGWLLCTIGIFFYSPLSVGNNGTLSISNNNMMMSNVNINSYWYVYTIYVSCNTTGSSSCVGTNGTMSITNNNMEASNMSIGGDWSVNTISSHSLYIGTNAILSISNNNMMVSSVSGDVSIFLIDAYVYDDGVLNIVDNNVIIVSSTTTNSSSLTSTTVVFNADALSGTGSVYILRNRISNGSVVDYSGTSSDVPVHTCSNYVGGVECYSYNTSTATSSRLQQYSCATGSSYINIDDCETHNDTTTTTSTTTTTTTSTTTTTTTTTTASPPNNAAPTPSDGPPTAIIAGSAVGGVLLVIAVVAGGVLAFNKFRNKNNNDGGGDDSYGYDNHHVPLHHETEHDGTMNMQTSDDINTRLTDVNVA